MGGDTGVEKEDATAEPALVRFIVESQVDPLAMLAHAVMHHCKIVDGSEKEASSQATKSVVDRLARRKSSRGMRYSQAERRPSNATRG
jgi:hypothetical protein